MLSTDAGVVLVLVTNQVSCERLIRAGHDIKTPTQELRILSICPKRDLQHRAEALEHLLSISDEVGAKMAIYYSDSPIETLQMSIQRWQVDRMVVGSNPSGSSMFLAQLRTTFPDIPITVVLPDCRHMTFEESGQGNLPASTGSAG